jgi:hypothetical protein
VANNITHDNTKLVKSDKIIKSDSVKAEKSENIKPMKSESGKVMQRECVETAKNNINMDVKEEVVMNNESVTNGNVTKNESVIEKDAFKTQYILKEDVTNKECISKEDVIMKECATKDDIVKRECFKKEEGVQPSPSTQSVTSVLSCCSVSALPVPVRQGWFDNCPDQVPGMRPLSPPSPSSTTDPKTPLPVLASWYADPEDKIEQATKK